MSTRSRLVSTSAGLGARSILSPSLRLGLGLALLKETEKKEEDGEMMEGGERERQSERRPLARAAEEEAEAET